MADLVTAAVLTSSLGVLDLHDEVSYKLESSTRDNRQVTHRKQDATNPYTEGSLTVHAVRENVTENVSVFVYGTGQQSAKELVDAFTDVLDLPYYVLALTIGDNDELWYCTTADYSIQTTQPLQVARMALVKAAIPRLPKVGTPG